MLVENSSPDLFAHCHILPISHTGVCGHVADRHLGNFYCNFSVYHMVNSIMMNMLFTLFDPDALVSWE